MDKRALAIVISFAFISAGGVAADNAPPFVDFSWMPQYPSVGENVTFNASASYDSDGSIVNYTWQFGDGSTGYGIIVTHAYMAEGIFNVTLTVMDNGGKKASQTKNVIVDGTSPFTTYESMPSSPNGKNGWYISGVRVELTAHDNLSGIYMTKYRIDSGEWKIYNESIEMEEGSHMLRFYSIDKSGNQEKIREVYFRIDHTPPSTNLNENISNEWLSEKVNITLSSFDRISGVEKTYYVIDGSLHTYDGEIEIGDGNHTIFYYSSDRAGNIEKPKKVIVKVDEYSPEVEITFPSDGIYMFGRKIASSSLTVIFGEIEIEAYAYDNTSGVSKVCFYVNGNKVYEDKTPPYSWRWEGRAIGIKEVKVVAYDMAGNDGEEIKNMVIFKI